MTTPSLDAALGFFAGLLDGTVDGTHDADGTGSGAAGGKRPESAELSWAELRWPGGGRVRLEEDRSADAACRPARAGDHRRGARELQLAGTRLVVRSVDRSR